MELSTVIFDSTINISVVLWFKSTWTILEIRGCTPAKYSMIATERLKSSWSPVVAPLDVTDSGMSIISTKSFFKQKSYFVLMMDIVLPEMSMYFKFSIKGFRCSVWN